MRQYLKNSEIVEVTDYPYGRLRTSLFDAIEFNPKKGYRTSKTTINPKTGIKNNPKRSTYSDFMIRFIDPETGYIKTAAFNIYGVERDLLTLIETLRNVWDGLIDDNEKSYLFAYILHKLKIEYVMSVSYNAGIDKEKFMEHFKNFNSELMSMNSNEKHSWINADFETFINEFKNYK